MWTGHQTSQKLIYLGNADTLDPKYQKLVIVQQRAHEWTRGWLLREQRTVTQAWPSFAVSFGWLFLLFSHVRDCSWPLPFLLYDYSCSHALEERLFHVDFQAVSALLLGPVGQNVHLPTGHCQVVDKHPDSNQLCLPQPHSWKFWALKQKLLQNNSSEAFLVSKWTDFQQGEDDQRTTKLYRHACSP